MPVFVERSQAEIDQQRGLAAEGIDRGSCWPSMSYEQGVKAALDWVTGDSGDAPMPDD